MNKTENHTDDTVPVEDMVYVGMLSGQLQHPDALVRLDTGRLAKVGNLPPSVADDAVQRTVRERKVPFRLIK